MICYCIICSTIILYQSILNATHTVGISKHVTAESGWLLYLWIYSETSKQEETSLIYWPPCISYVCAGLLLGQWQQTQMDGFPVQISEAVCLGSSLALSGICYYLYKKSRTTLDKLNVSCWSCVMNIILHKFLFSCCLSNIKEWH